MLPLMSSKPTSASEVAQLLETCETYVVVHGLQYSLKKSEVMVL